MTVQLLVYFDGGPYNGKLARIEMPGQFKVGMKVSLDGMIYLVMDGPSARLAEQTQNGHDNLAVRLGYCGKQEQETSQEAPNQETSQEGPNKTPKQDG